jgi:NADH:ubiquinone oxidoreductase subunit 3 (subunit A)
MANKKSKTQMTKQRIKTQYLLIAAATIALGSILVFLISYAVAASYIGNTGGIIIGLIIALLFAIVITYLFLKRIRPQTVTGRRK